MNAPNSVRATFEIVTPMFLGGADQQAGGIRAQSLKGELAFWWRALHFEEYVRGRGIASALHDMYADELILFGGPGGKGYRARQSAFLLSVENTQVDTLPADNRVLLRDGTVEPRDTRQDGNPRKVGPGTLYLGYGVIAAARKTHQNVVIKVPGQLERSCLAPGGTFDVTIRFRPLALRDGKLKGEDLRACELMDGKLADGLIRALKLLGLIGGLGSRKRRGWGSLAMTKLDCENWSPPATVEAYRKQLAELVGRRTVSGADWPLTAFANESDIRVGNKMGDDPLEALDVVGRGIQRYRSWGFSNNGAINPPRVNGLDSELNFRADHDWFKAENARPLNGNFVDTTGATTAVNALPRRASFGLPHNYFSRRGASNGQDLKMEIGGRSDTLDRRGSPLMIHIHSLLDRSSFPVFTYLPTKFLDLGTVRVGETAKLYTFDPTVITHFLDGNRPDGTASPGGPYVPSMKVVP